MGRLCKKSWQCEENGRKTSDLEIRQALNMGILCRFGAKGSPRFEVEYRESWVWEACRTWDNLYLLILDNPPPRWTGAEFHFLLDRAP